MGGGRTLRALIQGQLLKMSWLEDSIARILTLINIDITSKWGASLHFFIYDTLKLFTFLSVLIFLMSYIQTFLTPEKTRKILGSMRGWRGRVVAALLGTLTPFCSCSSIPIFVGFMSAGVPIGTTFSFLISSPMVDLGSLLLLSGSFGFSFAFSYVVFGLLIAVIGGSVIEKYAGEEDLEAFVRPRADFIPLDSTNTPTSRERLRYSKSKVTETLERVWKYIFIGVGIGAWIHNYIPTEWVEGIFGETNRFSVFLAVLAGTPMYADIFGTLPVAEGLLAKGAGVGTVVSFMMAVTTLSIPSFVLLRQAVKPKLLAIFFATVLAGMILVGYLLNGGGKIIDI